jgi:hypothetical protein
MGFTITWIVSPKPFIGTTLILTMHLMVHTKTLNPLLSYSHSIEVPKHFIPSLG